MTSLWRQEDRGSAAPLDKIDRDIPAGPTGSKTVPAISRITLWRRRQNSIAGVQACPDQLFSERDIGGSTYLTCRHDQRSNAA
jgi:hypothetical protein